MTVELSPTFKVQKHPGHTRLRHIIMDDNSLNRFFNSISHVDVQKVEYIPLMRFYLADQLRKAMGEDFQHQVRELLHDRNTGGFTIGVQGQTDDRNEYIKFSTALTHLIGISNFDAMSGKFYATFDVRHVFESDTFLKSAYRRLELHTDGTFVEEPTDWLLMMKMSEESAKGGESRLTHLDDWKDLDTFSKDPLASHKFKFTYADRGSKNVNDIVYRSTFYNNNNNICISLNPTCTHPQTIEESLYLKDLHDSLENSDATIPVKLPVGDLVMINNHFWLHGREPFVENVNLNRQLLRQRGRFALNK
ncbi:carbon starvation induced protein CsiD [bacterium LRH843]|nr:carbon starvation induced protein CsiD [bacterium LRH843]